MVGQVNFAELRTRATMADVIQLLNLPMTAVPRKKADDPPQFRGACPRCRSNGRALVATEGLNGPPAKGYTCFHRKVVRKDGSVSWPGGDVIAFYAHVRGVSMREAAEAIDEHITLMRGRKAPTLALVASK